MSSQSEPAAIGSSNSSDSSTPASSSPSVGVKSPFRHLAWTVAAIATAVVLVVVVINALQPTPVESLQLAQDAYLRHDLQEFNKYVDAEGVMGDAMDQTLDFTSESLHLTNLQYGTAKLILAGTKAVYLPRMAAWVEHFLVGEGSQQVAIPDVDVAASGGGRAIPASAGSKMSAAEIRGRVSGAMRQVVVFAISSQLSYKGVVSSQSTSRDGALVSIKVG